MSSINQTIIEILDSAAYENPQMNEEFKNIAFKIELYSSYSPSLLNQTKSMHPTKTIISRSK